MKKKSKRKLWDNAFRLDNCDGFKINNIVDNKKVSYATDDFSPYDSDTYHVKMANGNYRRVGIQNKIVKLNSDRSHMLNLYNERIRGR